jgi:hypothetical protein
MLDDWDHERDLSLAMVRPMCSISPRMNLVDLRCSKGRVPHGFVCARPRQPRALRSNMAYSVRVGFMASLEAYMECILQDHQR